MRELSARDDGPGQKTAAAVDAPQGTDQSLVRHSLDDVAARAGLQRLMNVFVALVGGEHDKFGVAVAGHHSADGVDAAHSRQAQIHERDVGKMLFEKLHGLFAAAGLGNHGHIGRGVDDGRNADTHDGVIVDNQDFDLCCFLHDRPVHLSARLVHCMPPACSSSDFGCKAISRGRVESELVEGRDHGEHVAVLVEEAATAQRPPSAAGSHQKTPWPRPLGRRGLRHRRAQKGQLPLRVLRKIRLSGDRPGVQLIGSLDHDDGTAIAQGKLAQLPRMVAKSPCQNG
jgi:hypothetical protein